MSGPRFEVPPRSYNEIVHVASSVRSYIRLDGGWFPIVEFLELAMPIIYPGFSFESGETDEMGMNHGLTIPSQNTVMLRNDVHLGACDGVGRDRFTAAHELGHYLLHRDVPLKYHRAVSGGLKAYVDSEWQANEFAAALLMPAEGVASCQSLEEVCVKFGVSTQAAQTQIRKLYKKQVLKRILV